MAIKMKTASTKRQFFLKLFAITVLVVTLQFFLQFQFNLTNYAFEFPEKRRLEDAIANHTQILLFGDSSVIWSAHGDKDPRTEGEMIQARLRAADMRASFEAIAHPAYNLAVYLKLTEFALKRSDDTAFFIIPLNLRSFSPLWDLSPGWQFEVEKLILSHEGEFLFKNLFRFLFSMKWYTAEPDYADELRHQLGVTPKELAPQATVPVTDQGPKSKILFEHFARCYMYPLGPHHRQLEALTQLMDLADKNHVPLFFYVPPINHQAATKVIGASFDARVLSNVTVLRNLVIPRGFEFLDLSFAINEGDFDDEGSLSTEHLRDGGRLKAVDLMVPALLRQFKKRAP